MDQSDSKRCTKCGETKPLPTGFHHDRSRPDGFAYWCKTCQEPALHRYKETHREAAHERYVRQRKNRPAQKPHGAKRKLSVKPGDRFGRGVVIEEFKTKRWCARLLCDCGTAYEATLSNLFSGNTQSCGCIHYEASAAWAAGLNRTHGMSGHQLYGTWQAMMSRCYDPKWLGYKHYGGRGIAVCERWHDGPTFIADIEHLISPRPDGMTLDRWPDNNGNYEPGNVRWATPLEQAHNKGR
jgi:hypothetical protein